MGMKEIALKKSNPNLFLIPYSFFLIPFLILHSGLFPSASSCSHWSISGQSIAQVPKSAMWR